jgi:hypothetical protein
LFNKISLLFDFNLFFITEGILFHRHPKISGFGIMQKQYIFKKSIFVIMHSVGITGARGMELPPPPF